MEQSDPPSAGVTPSLSRRQVLLAGTVGIAGAAGAELAPAHDDLPPLSWERDFDVPLAPGAHVLEAQGIVVAASNPIEADEPVVYALDVESGDHLWTAGMAATASLWSDDDTLYHQESRTLRAHDTDTGDVQWKLSGAFGNQFYRESGIAVFSGGTDTATVVDLREGTIAWRPERTFTDAVGLNDERAVLFGDGELAAFDAASGEESWRITDLPSGRFTVETYSDWPYGFVVGTDPERTIAVDLRDGERLWDREIAVVPRRVETESVGEVVLLEDTGTAQRLAPRTGEVIWERSLADERTFLTEVGAGLAVFVDGDQFWGLSLDDGSVVQSQSLDSAVRSIQEHDGEFFATGEDTTTFSRDGEPTGGYDLPAGGGAFPAIVSGHLVAVSGTSVVAFDLNGDGDEQTETTATPTETTTADEPPTSTTPTTGTDERSTATPTEDGTTPDTGTPGFGVLATVLGMGGFAEYIRRRERSEE